MGDKMTEQLKRLIKYQAKVKDAMEAGPRSDKQRKRPITYKAYLIKEMNDVTRKIEALKLEGK